MKRPLLASLIVIVALLASLLPTAPAGAAAPETVYFPQTGHNLGKPFLTYWFKNGGIPVYGYPLTEAFNEVSPTDGKTYLVQYFERARLEHHPENSAPWDIILGQLGRWSASRISGSPAFKPLAPTNAAPDAVYFSESKHSLRGGFLQYWKDNGGLEQFGFPLSEEFQEKSATDGKVYTVQYFERNRFEWHNENTAPYNVLLGLLGRDYARDRRISITPAARAQGAPDFDPALFAPPKPVEPRPDLGPGYIEINLSQQHLYVWQKGAMIFDVAISSGRPDWETPAGTFYIHTFIRLQDMEGGGQKGDPNYYFQPDVPWVMYFDNNGDAIHGVYWHNNFGQVASSHGCVGTPVWAAEWIYNWAWVGTPVWIHY